MMYELVRPQLAIPVHGEPVHIHEHAKLARKWGTPHAVEVENGSVVLLNSPTPKIIDMVENGYLGVEGNYLLPIDSPIFKMRRRMREDGIAVVTIILNANGKLAVKPIVSIPGCLDAQQDIDLIRSITGEIEESVSYALGSKQARKDVNIEDVVRNALRRILREEVGKNPMIIVNVEKVS
jgi:ribonuclease J